MWTHKWMVLFLALLLLAAVSVFAQGSGAVEMWIAFTDSRLDWTKQKAAEFHAQFPNLPEIDITAYPDYETLFKSATGAADAKSLPAIINYSEIGLQNAVDTGWFKPVARAVGSRADINGVPVNLKDFVPPAAAYYTIGGKLSAIPWNTSSAVMFSNMNLLRSAGIDAPPKTWAEMASDCAVLMTAASHPPYCFTWPNDGWFFEQWLAQQNALFANNANGRSDRATELVFNSDAGAAILAWLKDMVDKGYLYYSGAQGSDSWSTVDQAFNSQQVAMAIQSSANTAVYGAAAIQNGFELVASNLPYNQDAPGGWTGNVIGGGSLWLTNGLPKDVEDAALTWLFWLTNSDNTSDWHKTTGYIPIRQSAIKALTDSGWFKSNPNFMVAVQELTTSKKTPATAGALMGNFPAVRDLVTAAIDKALTTPGADLKGILDDTVASANRTLAEYNALNAG
jgi:sn-glycerol 3-phosphate transport system substrate-binding protein